RRRRLLRPGRPARRAVLDRRRWTGLDHAAGDPARPDRADVARSAGLAPRMRAAAEAVLLDLDAHQLTLAEARRIEQVLEPDRVHPRLHAGGVDVGRPRVVMAIHVASSAPAGGG